MDDATKKDFQTRLDRKIDELGAIMVEVNMVAMKGLQNCDCGEDHSTIGIEPLVAPLRKCPSYFLTT